MLDGNSSEGRSPSTADSLDRKDWLPAVLVAVRLRTEEVSEASTVRRGQGLDGLRVHFRQRLI